MGKLGTLAPDQRKAFGQAVNGLKDRVTETLEARKYFPNYHGALRAIGMSDDDWAPTVTVAGLIAGYTGTKPEHITVTPETAGQKKIGHFGYFREPSREPLWREAAEWLGRD